MEDRTNLSWPALCLLLSLCNPVLAQQAPAEPSAAAIRADRLRWLDALQERFDQLQDPVASVYAKARLAAMTCPLDRADGTRQFQDAFSALKTIPPDAFDKSRTVLAADTFTALYDLVIPPAKVCNAEAGWYDANLDRRKSAEYMKANVWLAAAIDMAGVNPERAAQLVRAALSLLRVSSKQRSMVAMANHATHTIESWPPDTKGAVIFGESPMPDLALLTRALRKLKAQSPDLSDSLFRMGVRQVTSLLPPFAGDLAELAAYLYPTESSVQLGDALLDALAKSTAGRKVVIDLPSVPNIMAAELNADSQLAADFLSEAAGLLLTPESTHDDAARVYALALELAPKARQLEDEHVTAFENAQPVLEAALGDEAVKIRAKMGDPPPPQKIESGSAQATLMALSRARAAYVAGADDGVRAALTELGNHPARAKIQDLLQFSETGESFASRDIEAFLQRQAMQRELYPDAGMKRALLYAGMALSARDHATALKAMALGLSDAAALPAAQRPCVLSPLAASALPAAPDQALQILREWVKADNDSAGSPAQPADDLCRSTGPVEVVAAGAANAAFPLKVPGFTDFSIEAFLGKIQPADFSAAAEAVLGLSDEPHLVNALLSLAQFRTGH